MSEEALERRARKRISTHTWARACGKNICSSQTKLVDDNDLSYFRSQVHLRMAEEALTDEIAESFNPKVVKVPYVVNLEGVEGALTQ